MSDKKYMLGYLFIVLCVFPVGATPVFAASFGVDPGRITADQPLPPGRTIELPPRDVVNDTDHDMRVTVTVSDHRHSERQLPPAEWFTFEPTELTVAAAERGEVRASITLPMDAPPGSYAVWFEYSGTPIDAAPGVPGVSLRSPFVFDVKAVDHIITLSTRGEGTLTPAPDEYTRHQGTQLQLVAEPAEGWQFIHWVGLPLDAGAEYTHTVTDEIDITAVFERKEYQVTVHEPEGQGTVSPEPDTYTHEFEDELQLIAEAPDFWIFARWEGPVQDAESAQTYLTVTADAEVTPVFAEAELTDLQVTPSTLHLAPEESVDVQAVASYEDGTEVDVTEDAQWTLEDDEIATYEDGELTAQQVGGTALAAEYQEFMVQSPVQVQETPTSSASVYPWVVLAAIAAVGGFIVYSKRNRSGVR